MSLANKAVVWSDLLKVIAILCGISSAALGAVWSAHNSYPHKGSVTQDEFHLVISRLERIEAKLDRVCESMHK